MKGSLTIEGSIIYPIVIFISILLVMYSFFIHDKLATKSELYRILMENNSSGTTLTTSDIDKRLQNNCLLSHTYKIQYLDENAKLQLTDTSHKNDDYYKHFSLSMILSFTGHERCDFIRRYYTVLNIKK